MAKYSNDAKEERNEEENTMSDDDLIKRGEVRRTIAEFIKTNKALVDEWAANCIDDIIDEIPAAPQEMTAREFAKQMLRSERWCIGKSCVECDYRELCGKIADNRTSEFTIPTAANAYVKLIEKWTQERPEERSEE